MTGATTTTGLELAKALLEEAKKEFLKGAHYHGSMLCRMDQEGADDYTAAIAAVDAAAAELKSWQSKDDWYYEQPGPLSSAEIQRLIAEHHQGTTTHPPSDIAMCMAGDAARITVDDATSASATYRAMIAAAPEATR